MTMEIDNLHEENDDGILVSRPMRPSRPIRLAHPTRSKKRNRSLTSKTKNMYWKWNNNYMNTFTKQKRHILISTTKGFIISRLGRRRLFLRLLRKAKPSRIRLWIWHLLLLCLPYQYFRLLLCRTYGRLFFLSRKFRHNQFLLYRSRPYHRHNRSSR